jgi:hypothetical protein
MEEEDVKRLPFAIIILVIFLAVFYNIERLDISDQNLVNISTFVYILGTIMIIFNIMLKALRRINFIWVILGWDILYILLKLILLKPALTWGGVYTYTTLVELFLISIGAGLSCLVGWNLNDFEDAVERITFSEIKRACNLREVIELIQNEVYRCRRYNHPLTLFMVQPLADSRKVVLNRTIREVQDAMISRYMSISMAQALFGHIRRTDILVEQPDKGRFLVVSPETDAKGAEMVTAKVMDAAKEIGAQVVLSQSYFPDDALTFEELMNQGELRLAESMIERERKVNRGRKNAKSRRK